MFAVRRRLRSICLLTASLFALDASARNEDLQAIKELIQGGFHHQALERIDELSAAGPEEPQILFLKGIALAETGRTDEAMAVFTRLAAEHPELPEPHNNLAVLQAMRGDYEAARTALVAALDASPSNARYHENLGDLYAHLAVESYGRAVELEESSDRAEAKLELLRKLLEGPETAAIGSVSESDVAESDATASAAAPPSPCAAAVDAVRAWAAAWASQDFERYLGYYSDAFEPVGGLSREKWEAERRHRLKRPRFIEVTIEEPEVELCADRRVRLVFTQSYRSDVYRDRVEKELWMSRTDAGWRILGERTLD